MGDCETMLVTVVEPVTGTACDKAAECDNQGAFTTSCGCYCTLEGFSGSTCNTCSKTCTKGTRLTGANIASSAVCGCECKQGYFDWTSQGDCTIKLQLGTTGSTRAVKAGKAMNFNVENAQSDEYKCS